MSLVVSFSPASVSKSSLYACDDVSFASLAIFSILSASALCLGQKKWKTWFEICYYLYFVLQASSCMISNSSFFNCMALNCLLLITNSIQVEQEPVCVANAPSWKFWEWAGFWPSIVSWRANSGAVFLPGYPRSPLVSTFDLTLQMPAFPSAGKDRHKDSVLNLVADYFIPIVQQYCSNRKWVMHSGGGGGRRRGMPWQ